MRGFERSESAREYAGDHLGDYMVYRDEARFWAAAAAYHHRMGEWQEAQAAAAIAQVYATLEVSENVS